MEPVCRIIGPRRIIVCHLSLRAARLQISRTGTGLTSAKRSMKPELCFYMISIFSFWFYLHLLPGVKKTAFLKMEQIRKYFERTCKLTDKDWRTFSAKLVRQEFPQKTLLLKVGQTENHLSFIGVTPQALSRIRKRTAKRSHALYKM